MPISKRGGALQRNRCRFSTIATVPEVGNRAAHTTHAHLVRVLDDQWHRQAASAVKCRTMRGLVHHEVGSYDSVARTWRKQGSLRSIHPKYLICPGSDLSDRDGRNPAPATEADSCSHYRYNECEIGMASSSLTPFAQPDECTAPGGDMHGQRHSMHMPDRVTVLW